MIDLDDITLGLRADVGSLPLLGVEAHGVALLSGLRQLATATGSGVQRACCGYNAVDEYIIAGICPTNLSNDFVGLFVLHCC
jgi:hypothetical protein